MGIELTQSPDTFGDGAAQIVQAPYLAVCLSGTTQGGLCGMRVKAYREDATRDAMLIDDTTPVDSNVVRSNKDDEPKRERPEMGQTVMTVEIKSLFLLR